MPGVIPHIIIAIVCLIAVHLMHFKWEYSFSIFAGNFIPDVIKFGFSAIKQGTFAIFHVEKDGFYLFLSEITSSYAIWFSLGFFLIGTFLLLYHFHYIKKKKMEEYSELYLFLLLGIVIHLALDALFHEKNPWI